MTRDRFGTRGPGVTLPCMVSPTILARLGEKRAVALVMVLVVAVTAVCWGFGLHPGVDSSVYRSGAAAVLHGRSLYGQLAGAAGLPFIYPPIAAVVFAPLALLPPQVAWGLVVALSVLGLALVLRAAAGATGTTWPRRVGPGVVLVGVFALEPVWLTLSFGQVNILLMALVVLDVLALPRSRYRGALVGLAAAIKLTPLVFVPYLLLTGRRADAARALGTFAALNALGWVLLPDDTVRFWRSQMLGGVHVTTSSWYGNQSLNGLIQRLSHHADWAFAAAVVAGLVCVAVALPLARRLHAKGDDLGGLLVTAFAGTLASPISWTHHWIWVAPLAVLLIRRGRRPMLAVAALGAVFTGWTFALVPTANGQELTWTPAQMVLGNAYVLAGLAAGIVLCCREFSPARWARLVAVCRRFGPFPTRTRISPPAPDPADRVSPAGDLRGS